jgi:hypothetical protein
VKSSPDYLGVTFVTTLSGFMEREGIISILVFNILGTFHANKRFRHFDISAFSFKPLKAAPKRCDGCEFYSQPF